MCQPTDFLRNVQICCNIILIHRYYVNQCIIKQIRVLFSFQENHFYFSELEELSCSL
jgi:hypothetical protein